MSKNRSLSKVLAKKVPKPRADREEKIEKLQKRVLRVQQGVWHQKARVILVFEGFDAAGKGGTIRKLTEKVDPRGVQVHPISAPDANDQAKHYLYRFWQKLPAPGSFAIFDRSWYGRMLVEKVEGLTSPKRLKKADQEINEFERMLTDDGVIIIKFFMAVSKDEQLRRYEDRLKDPTKRWKLTADDIQARKKWKDYVKATDALLKKTHTKNSPWYVIRSDNKELAHEQVLELVVKHLSRFERWMNSEESKWVHQDMKKQMKLLRQNA